MKANTKEYQVIVNKDDQIIGFKERGTLTGEDIYRVSSIWIFNENGELLIAQRPKWKKNDPGKWTESAVGTNEKGETYESNATKEVFEELGLQIKENDLIPVSKEFFQIREWQLFGQMFIYKFDSKRQSLAINLYEVPEVKWLSNSNIRNLLQEDVTFFVDGFEKYYNIVADYYRKITAY